MAKESQDAGDPQEVTEKKIISTINNMRSEHLDEETKGQLILGSIAGLGSTIAAAFATEKMPTLAHVLGFTGVGALAFYALGKISRANADKPGKNAYKAENWVRKELYRKATGNSYKGDWSRN